MVVLLAALTVVGIAVVAMRRDQVVTSRRIQALQFRQAELQRKIWTQELEIARLRSPGAVRDRAEVFGLDVEPDASGQGASSTR
jgi:uncharacterized membrane protein YdbT with pleckstrin-like domain